MRPISQIAILAPGDIKHQPLGLTLTRFKWLLDRFELEKFLIFGVIRDPIDFVISLYNSHREEKFKGNNALYTANLSFDEFFEKWTKRGDWQIDEQYKRFLDNNGNIGANYIISYDNLTEGLLYVGTRLNTQNLVSMRRDNESQKYLLRDALTEAQSNQVKERFAGDYWFMAQFCNKLLSPDDRRSWASFQPI